MLSSIQLAKHLHNSCNQDGAMIASSSCAIWKKYCCHGNVGQMQFLKLQPNLILKTNSMNPSNVRLQSKIPLCISNRVHEIRIFLCLALPYSNQTSEAKNYQYTSSKWTSTSTEWSVLTYFTSKGASTTWVATGAFTWARSSASALCLLLLPRQ